MSLAALFGFGLLCFCQAPVNKSCWFVLPIRKPVGWWRDGNGATIYCVALLNEKVFSRDTCVWLTAATECRTQCDSYPVPQNVCVRLGNKSQCGTAYFLQTPPARFINFSGSHVALNKKPANFTLFFVAVRRTTSKAHQIAAQLEVSAHFNECKLKNYMHIKIKK